MVATARRLIIVMGVSGCGKSTIAGALSEALGGLFLEGDEFHPDENVAKMRAGTPLNDQDRIRWMDAILDAIAAAKSRDVILACSALTPYVQERLRDAAVDTYHWAHLDINQATASDRMHARAHFMPPELLASQFSALQLPDDAMRFDASLPVDELVAQISQSLNG